MKLTIGNEYDAYEDGKMGRRCKALLLGVIPYDMIDRKTYKLWRKEVKENDYLYSDYTDYFLIVKVFEDGLIKDAVFVRYRRGWYGINWNGSLKRKGFNKKYFKEVK